MAFSLTPKFKFMIGFEAKKINLRSPISVAEYTGAKLATQNQTFNQYNDVYGPVRSVAKLSNNFQNVEEQIYSPPPRLQGDIYSFKKNNENTGKSRKKSDLADQIILIMLPILFAGICLLLFHRF